VTLTRHHHSLDHILYRPTILDSHQLSSNVLFQSNSDDQKKTTEKLARETFKQLRKLSKLCMAHFIAIHHCWTR